MTKWIGVDLDGTLAFYPNSGHNKWAYQWNKIGDPLPPMVRRIKKWTADGQAVRILTARVFPYIYKHPDPENVSYNIRQECLVTGQFFTISDMIEVIQNYTLEHIGMKLPVTCAKDWHMIQLWDDRAVQVIPNLGHPYAPADDYADEEQPARLAAKGKSQGLGT